MTLFDLATHFPTPLLAASRERWLNFTGPAPSDDGHTTLWVKYPHEDKVPEIRMQLYSIQAVYVDVVPGTIWSCLKDDVFSSTVQAIEMMIAELENATIEPAPTDRTAVRRRFAELHKHFSHLARLAGGFGNPEWQHVKLATSFRMPAARTWCDFPMDVRFETLRLSQGHANAEYLLHRHMDSDLRTLLEQAGNALPPEISDGPVMFHRQLGGHVVSSRAHLDPSPVAKWVRFVFNSLRENESSGDEVCFNYESAVDRVLNPFEDIYGYATLKNGFFAASAKAIELAGLLPTPVASSSGPASQASETGDSPSPIMVTANPSSPQPSKPPKRSSTRGEGRLKLVAALTKHHRYADGSCLMLEPINNKELAKLAKVAPSTASAFFRDKFEGHSKYRAMCRDSGTLAVALKMLNGEFAPHLLYGSRPVEGDN